MCVLCWILEIVAYEVGDLCQFSHSISVLQVFNSKDFFQTSWQYMIKLKEINKNTHGSFLGDSLKYTRFVLFLSFIWTPEKHLIHQKEKENNYENHCNKDKQLLLISGIFYLEIIFPLFYLACLSLSLSHTSTISTLTLLSLFQIGLMCFIYQWLIKRRL